MKYTCTFPGCTYSCKSIGDLKKHERVHTKERPYKCTFPGCNSAFTQSSHLYTHMQKHKSQAIGNLLIEQTSPFACDFPGCVHRCTTERSLMLHKQIHMDQPHYRCSYPGCQYIYYKQEDCEQHYRTHESPSRNSRKRKGTITLYCPDCTYSCSSKKFLTRHLRLVHGIVSNSEIDSIIATQSANNENAGNDPQSDQQPTQKSEVPKKSRTLPRIQNEEADYMDSSDEPAPIWDRGDALVMFPWETERDDVDFEKHASRMPQLSPISGDGDEFSRPTPVNQLQEFLRPKPVCKECGLSVERVTPNQYCAGCYSYFHEKCAPGFTFVIETPTQQVTDKKQTKEKGKKPKEVFVSILNSLSHLF